AAGRPNSRGWVPENRTPSGPPRPTSATGLDCHEEGTEDMTDDLPTIITTDRRPHEIAEDALRALAAQGGLYQRDGRVVHIRIDERGHQSVEVVRPIVMQHYLARAARWYRLDPRGERVPTSPSRSLARDILGSPRLPFPTLQEGEVPIAATSAVTE